MDIWVEKYRPKKLDQIILEDSIRIQVSEWIKNPFQLPNLLLSSKEPGTGKTTLARIIIRTLNADYLELNASDERGIQTIRDSVSSFANSMRLNRNAPKIVFLDEADYLTHEAQAVLRHLMEDVMENTRFILTCNSRNKIIEPLISRCQLLQLNRPPKELVISRIKSILTQEQVECAEDFLIKVVDNYYPRIRDMLNFLQQWKVSGKKLTVGSSLSSTEEFWQLIVEKKQVLKARKLWLTQAVDPRELILSFSQLVENLDPMKRRKASLILAKYDYRMAVGANPEVQLTAMAWELSEL